MAGVACAAHAPKTLALTKHRIRCRHIPVGRGAIGRTPKSGGRVIAKPYAHAIRWPVPQDRIGCGFVRHTPGETKKAASPHRRSGRPSRGRIRLCRFPHACRTDLCAQTYACPRRRRMRVSRIRSFASGSSRIPEPFRTCSKRELPIFPVSPRFPPSERNPPDMKKQKTA